MHIYDIAKLTNAHVKQYCVAHEILVLIQCVQFDFIKCTCQVQCLVLYNAWIKKGGGGGGAGSLETLKIIKL